MTDLKTLRQTLRDLAEDATEGEWYVVETDHHLYKCPNQHIRSRAEKADYAIAEAFGGEGPRPNDARYIAAANPENILRLLDALETAEAALEKYADSSGRIMVPNDNGHTEHCRENGCYGHFIDQKVNAIADEALSKLRGGR